MVVLSIFGVMRMIFLCFFFASIVSGAGNAVDLFADVNTDTITKPLDEMRQAGYQEEMVEKEDADEKVKSRFGNINTKFNEIVTTLDDDQKEAAVTAISSVVSGSGTLVNGIRNDDIFSSIAGGLEIAAAVVSLAGPVGSIIGTVLQLASTIFSFFGGSSAPAQKKEEPNFKKIVEEAIEAANVNELKIQIAGVKSLYKTVSASVAEFRKQVEGGASLKKEIGLELYDHAFKELVAFGILREVIEKYCDDPDDTANRNTYATRCGTFTRLYCNLAIQRKLLLLDIASVLSNNEDLKELTANTLFLMKRQLEDDHNFFRFLSDPINFPKRRYAVHKIFRNSQDNRFVIMYLKLLKKTFPHYPGFYKPPVIGCVDRQLQGSCVALFNGIPARFKNDEGSMFVPLGVKVTKEEVLTNRQTIPKPVAETKTDVLLGAATHHISHHLYHKLLRLTYVETSTDASEHIVICGKKGTNNDLCKVFERSEDGDKQYSFKNLFDEVKTLLLPDRYKLRLLKADGNTIRTFVGPDYLQSVCQQNEWKEAENIKIEKIDSIRKVKLCSDADLAGNCQDILVPKYVKLDPIYDITTGRDDSCPINEIKSMKIPEGVEVLIYEYKEWVLNENNKGPYTGPITVNLKENTTWHFVKVYDLTLSPFAFCTSMDLKGTCYQRSDAYSGDWSRIAYQLKSIRVPKGKKATLYTEQLYKGRSKPVPGPRRLTNYEFRSYRQEDVTSKR